MPSLESDHDSDARKDVKDTNALNYQSKQNVKNNFQSVISAHGNFQSVRAGVTLHEPVALPHNVRVTDEDGDDANLMDSEDETPKNRPVDPLENDVSLTLNLTPGEQINISIDVQAPLPQEPPSEPKMVNKIQHDDLHFASSIHGAQMETGYQEQVAEPVDHNKIVLNRQTTAEQVQREVGFQKKGTPEWQRKLKPTPENSENDKSEMSAMKSNNIYVDDEEPQAVFEIEADGIDSSDRKFLKYGIPILIIIVIVSISLISILFLDTSESQIVSMGKDQAAYDTIDEMTHRAFMDIVISRNKTTDRGRIVIGLFGHKVPKTVKNFIDLSNGKATSKMTQRALTYKNTIFHTVKTGFMAQGGDTDVIQDGVGGESIYGSTFEDENFTLRHSKPYLLSMVSNGKDTNGSQFLITFKPTPQLDGINVVFGQVIDGFNILKSLEAQGSEDGKPRATITVYNCGTLPNY